jgi:hypothetical protein
MERLAGFVRPSPALDRGVEIVGMKVLCPALVFDLLKRHSGVLDPLAIEVISFTAGCSRENLLGHRFGHKAKAFVRLLGVLQGFLPIAQGPSQTALP